MHMILMGPPGAGKGTQAETLKKELNIPHISTGDMFRQAIKDETVLGKKAQSYMDAGKLVPDEVTIGIVRDRLAKADCQKGFLLDGFPRNVLQAEALKGILNELGLPLDAAININVPKENLVQRLTGRRVCKNCGASYHMLFNQPAVEGVCDSCQGELYQRSDDTQETVENRLNVYEEKTAPLIAYYQEQGVLKEIDGDKPIAEVLADIVTLFK